MGIVNQLCVKLENRPGALAELCSELAKKAVNIAAIEGGDARRNTPIRLVVSPMDAARKVLDAMRIDYTEERAVAVHLAERPGALGRVTRKLAEKGIQIEYIYGSIERNASRALIVLGVSDLEAAARILK